MITPRQIKAARALAGCTTTELGEKTNLAAGTITNIENGKTQAQEGSIERIAKAFDNMGVEFTPNEGVRIKQGGFETLIGQAGLQQFFEGVYEHARKHGGTIVQTGVDEKQFLECLGKEFSYNYVDRMHAVYGERKDLKVKAIVCEDETLMADYNEYRWISKDTFQAVPFYIYGDNLAIMDFQTIPAPTIFLLKSTAIANAYRKQFDELWKIAREMPNKEKAK